MECQDSEDHGCVMFVLILIQNGADANALAV